MPDDDYIYMPEFFDSCSFSAKLLLNTYILTIAFMEGK